MNVLRMAQWNVCLSILLARPLSTLTRQCGFLFCSQAPRVLGKRFVNWTDVILEVGQCERDIILKRRSNVRTLTSRWYKLRQIRPYIFKNIDILFYIILVL